MMSTCRPIGYDLNGRLIAVSKRATDGGTLQLSVDYKYDALGRRIERTENSNGDGNADFRERFGYDGEHGIIGVRCFFLDTKK